MVRQFALSDLLSAPFAVAPHRMHSVLLFLRSRQKFAVLPFLRTSVARHTPRTFFACIGGHMLSGLSLPPDPAYTSPLFDFPKPSLLAPDTCRVLPRTEQTSHKQTHRTGS